VNDDPTLELEQPFAAVEGPAADAGCPAVEGPAADAVPAAAEGPSRRGRRRWGRIILREVLLPLAIAFTLALTVQATVAKPFEISTGSMNPTIMPSDRVLANRFIYHLKGVARGDIVVFDPPAELHSTVPFVKRVVGLPGDVVEVRAGKLFVNGQPFYVEGAAVPRYTYGPTVVPADRVFVLGDNRNNSVDSHVWGFLPKSAILGQVFMTYWPPEHLRLF
jgi:signal peptidase I